jgi:hypothetical protein
MNETFLWAARPDTSVHSLAAARACATLGTDSGRRQAADLRGCQSVHSPQTLLLLPLDTYNIQVESEQAREVPMRA